MAHHTLRSAYSDLTERLNRFPQGAPSTERLYAILKLLFSEREASLVAQLPIKPFNARQASEIWKTSLVDAQKTLDTLADRAILIDAEQNGESQYALPPPMAGFFEFSMMRVRADIDQRLLSELFYQYLTVEDDFFLDLFRGAETQVGRAFVQEPAVPAEYSLIVLDYERASHIIRSARHISVGMCYCRHKMQHLGQACQAPMDICMTFNGVADSLSRHGAARKIDTVECLDLLDLAYANNLVQFGENSQQGVSFICNCCGCCCEAMIAQRRFSILHPIHTTNFLPEIEASKCNGCGKCVSACPVEAMSLVSANDPSHLKRKKAKLDEDLCLGCGVCVRTCAFEGLKLVPRRERVITPVNSVHRIVLMAIERNQLQNLVFDNRALFSHRAMAAVLGAILRLPPAKQLLASQQLKSRYLAAVIQRFAPG